MATGIRPDGVIFASGAKEGEVQEFPSLKRGWGVTIDGKDPDGTVITESTNSIPPMEWFNQLQQKTDQNILWLLQNALPDWLAGTWPKGAVVVNGDVVWRAQKETTAEPTASNGDWLELFPLQKLDGRYVPQTQLQTSKDDATAGHIMTVGAFGLGGAEIGIPDGKNIYKFFATAKSGNHGGGGNLPGSLTSGWRSFKWQQHGSDNKYGTLLEIGSDGKAALHVYNNANGDMTNPENYWSNHGLLYGEKNKPSAADVGALSTGGGTLSGQLTVSGTGHGSYASQRDAGAPVYQLVDSTSTSEFWPIIKQKYKQKNSAWSLGMLINANRFNVYYSDPTQSNDKSWSFNADGTFVPPNYSNFDAKYQAKLSGPLPVSSGGTGSTTAAGARTNLGCGTAATMSYSTAAYTQLAGSPTEAASTKQLVGLRDAVYTKTAGDARYQLKNTASKAASGWFKDTTTGIITQWQKIQTTTANDNSFTFPIAFPNANLGCVGTVMDQSNPDAGVRTVKIASRTKTGFNCTTVNGSGHMACPVFVYSVGY